MPKESVIYGIAILTAFLSCRSDSLLSVPAAEHVILLINSVTCRQPLHRVGPSSLLLSRTTFFLNVRKQLNSTFYLFHVAQRSCAVCASIHLPQKARVGTTFLSFYHQVDFLPAHSGGASTLHFFSAMTKNFIERRANSFRYLSIAGPRAVASTCPFSFRHASKNMCFNGFNSSSFDVVAIPSFGTIL